MSLSRSLSLAGSLLGAVCNLAFALKLLALSRSLIWEGESESEWEGSFDVWAAADSVRIVWALLFAYFATAAAACLVGFVGIAKHVRLFVRIYRDYSIADFVFVMCASLGVGYSTFSSPYVRSTVCEVLSRHPELMREMGEMGLSLENCEQWFERAVIGIMCMMFILIVVRLHIVIALSQFYSHISYTVLARARALGLRPINTDVPMQRIYLMPTPTTTAGSPSDGRSHHFSTDGSVAVYATVPIGSMSEEEARRMHATEAWITTSPVSASSPRQHRHSHSSSHSHSHRHHGSGRSNSKTRSATDEKTPFVV